MNVLSFAMQLMQKLLFFVEKNSVYWLSKHSNAQPNCTTIYENQKSKTELEK